MSSAPTLINSTVRFPLYHPSLPTPHPTARPRHVWYRLSQRRDIAQEAEDLSDEENEIKNQLKAIQETGNTILIPHGRMQTLAEERADKEGDEADASDMGSEGGDFVPVRAPTPPAPGVDLPQDQAMMLQAIGAADAAVAAAEMLVIPDVPPTPSSGFTGLRDLDDEIEDLDESEEEDGEAEEYDEDEDSDSIDINPPTQRGPPVNSTVSREVGNLDEDMDDDDDDNGDNMSDWEDPDAEWSGNSSGVDENMPPRIPVHRFDQGASSPDGSAAP